MRAFITGGTGFLGRVLARRLLAEGVLVRLYVRNANRATALQDAGAEVTIGDLLDRAALRAAMQPGDVVFHIAAALSGTHDAHVQTNIGGTRAVINAAADVGIERVVHVSTIAVYGFCYQRPHTEALPPAPGCDSYAMTKAAAETVVHEIGEARGQPYTIIRPGMIYGAGAGLWTRTFFQLATARFTPFVADADGLAPYIHVDDVVDQMRVMAEHPAALGQIFNSVGSPNATYRDILNAYARLAGKTPRHVALPPALLHTVAQVAALFSEPHAQACTASDLVAFIGRRVGFPMEKAARLLNWSPQISLEHGVARCADWLKAQNVL